MKTYLYIILCLLFMCLNQVSGYEVFKQLTINNGLAHTDANSIVQDSTGLIWIGTYAGLQSYDGYNLKTFDYYTAEHRFFETHNRISTMVCSKDRLWIGTESGLTCFDLNTHRYIPYYVANNEANYHFNSFIPQITLDPSGCHLWIKTAKETIVAEIRNDTIVPLKWNSEEERLMGKNLNNICFQGESVWAIVGNQIAQLIIRQGKVTLQKTYRASQLLQKDEKIQRIHVIYDFLYIRTQSGCYRVRITSDQLHKSNLLYTNFHAINPKIPALTNGKFTVGKDGTLWCAYSEGIFEVRYPFSEEPSIREYLRNTRDDYQSAQKIKEMLIDRYNNLWVATSSRGVFYRTLSKSFFKNLSQSDFGKLGFSQNEIVSITGQENGTIWMIVEYASLFCYNPQTERLSIIPLPKDLSQTIYYQDVIMSHDQRHLYIGTSHGIFIYDTQQKNMWHLSVDSPEISQKINTSIADLREDAAGNLWVGTWGYGLVRISNPLGKPEATLQLDTQTDPAILSDLISNILINKESILLCTTEGLNRLVLTDTGNIQTLSAYRVNPDSPETSMSTNFLASIDSNNDSIFWVGTIGGGLNKITIHSERNNDYTATCYTTRDGLTNNDCEIVMVDHFGNVWVAGNGITQLDVLKNKIYTYGSAEGLQNNAFKINVSHKGKDGTLFMGGLYGLSYFHPDLFTYKAKTYTLVFTGLSVNNKTVVPHSVYDGRVLLERILDRTTRLTLNHRQNNFTISFAALGYELSGQIMYRYRLKGFQNEWHTLRYAGNEVSFSNLPYDSYELEVQLSTDKGYTWCAPGKKLIVEVLPPWWLSNWAKVSYVAFVSFVLFIAFRQYNKEQNLKKENEIQKILIAQDEEKYQTKMQFFMNASHELKTPLTLILLAAEKRADNGGTDKENTAILHNARKMLSLITELVDIRKQDLGIATPNLSYINLSQITRQLYDEIYSWAETKNIAISYTADEEAITLDADKNKVGKMIINLFSNAIKYTGEGGRIEISLRKGMRDDITPCYPAVYTEGSVHADQPVCILTVKDTGVGISSDSIRFIYERFFQVKDKTQNHLGSGIGLAIVKSTVLQHKGMIIVSSERMKGSEFIVALPICHQQLEEQPVSEVLPDVESFISEQYNEFTLETAENEAAGYTPVLQSELPTLLIVEDNRELQVALKEHFSSNYNVLIADNGRVGLKICMSTFPDIIISDVMMPEMDGIEMCKRIKNNLSVAYIPIVMLTAKDSVENQIEGYESGADLYLPKPFSMKLLETNLHRLLKQRERWFKEELQHIVANDVAEKETLMEEGEPKKQKGNTTEETSKSMLKPEELHAMTQKLKQIIYENLHNPDLSPDQLANAMGISRSKLYRDLKRVDGQSLSDYVRNIRLEKAAYLLINTNMNIQEIMNEVGFVNSSHFTKVFKLKFKITPSEYKRRN